MVCAACGLAGAARTKPVRSPCEASSHPPSPDWSNLPRPKDLVRIYPGYLIPAAEVNVLSRRCQKQSHASTRFAGMSVVCLSAYTFALTSCQRYLDATLAVLLARLCLYAFPAQCQSCPSASSLTLWGRSGVSQIIAGLSFCSEG